MRIGEHPVLDFDRGKKTSFYFNGEEIEGYENETILAALHAAGVRRLGYSQELHRPRGLFCAVGNCAGCFMRVDDQPNMRVCVMQCREGMIVEEQDGRGVVNR